jgi:hypothetical protein
MIENGFVAMKWFGSVTDSGFGEKLANMHVQFQRWFEIGAHAWGALWLDQLWVFEDILSVCMWFPIVLGKYYHTGIYLCSLEG